MSRALYVTFAAAVLAVVLAVVSAAAPLPQWPPVFYQTFKEHTKILEAHDTTGYMYYDSVNNVELIYRADGRGDRYCGSVRHDDKACVHLVNGGERYLVWPTEKYCCKCCTAEKGCGVVKSTWLTGAVYNGTEVVDGVQCNRWNQKGLQNNFYSQTDAGVPCRLLQEPNDDQVFDITSFKTGPFDQSLFAIPDYCEKSCPLFSVCTIA
jgi:hypothetical protein